jgi:hypothetical protein
MKKIFLIISGILILPLKSLALTYQPLEGDVFTGFGNPITASTTDPLGQFLSQAFQFGLAIAAALAVIMIVWGGVEIMLSESVFKKEDGKKKIQDAIWGLLLALASWLILYIINPDILNFKL